MSEEGFIRLSRRAFQHFLWKEPREKSRWEAWVDLIQSAAYAPETVLVKGRRISLVRGELVASVRYLAVRWGWDKNRVGRFLDILKAETMIETRNETGVSVLKLCKYDHYNPQKDKRGTPERTESGTVAGQSRDSDGTNRRREEGEEENGTRAIATPGGRSMPVTIEDVKLSASRFQPTSSVPKKPDDGFVEWWWDEQEKAGWVDPRSGLPWRDWQAALSAAWRANFHNQRQRDSKTYAPNQQHSHGRNAGATGAATLRNR